MMPKDELRALASRGGKAAHAEGKAHKFTSEEARVAGSKGGKATHAKRSRDKPDTIPAPPPSSALDPELYPSVTKDSDHA